MRSSYALGATCPHTIPAWVVATAIGVGLFAAASVTLADGGDASTVEAGRDARAPSVEITAGRTTTVRVLPDVGRPLERKPEFLAQAPSFRRAVELDGDQRWAEASALYQQALIEIGDASRLTSTPFLERAAFKIDLERQRARALAHDAAARNGGVVGTAARSEKHGPSAARLPARDRARMLRLKLMLVRSTTGAVPGELVSATLGALIQALRQAEQEQPRTKDMAPVRGGDPEVRLLLCATRAVAGDRIAARLELAHVSRANRTDPARALALAACQAALRYDDDALASLAVAVYRLGPSRLLPQQTLELAGSNDWDTLRADPRFDRLFQ
jgi:hypothetical protein